MSWIGGYKGPAKKESESREEKRKKLEAERTLRAQHREKLRKQVQAAQEAEEESDQAVKNILAIDPDILAGDDTFVSESEIDNLLTDDVGNQTPIVDIIAETDFDQENGEDSATAMENLRSVQCPFNKGDVEFWLSQ